MRRRQLHRDSKPANVFRTASGAVKLLDFGLAQLASDSRAQITQTGEPIGTVNYMSPEQMRGHAVDARSDLWSLGVLGYELLTGISPFQADSSVATALRILNEEPADLAPVPGVASWLEELINRLLRKSAAERPSARAKSSATSRAAD
jgi:serine/threonine-protein kinase